tara:strand:+ start:39 stop:587 length:549 start_codon:yes stop_codon:yes gene_type:complete
MKTITKEYTVYDLEDLKQDDELCEKIYQKFWLNDANNTNPWADENINSFKKFADTLNMKLDFSLSNADYPDRGCYIKLTPDYELGNKDYREALENYTGNGYCFCDDLKTFTLKLLDKEEYGVLGEGDRYKAIIISTNDFAQEIQNKMFDLWFADNKDYFSKESFLNDIEANEWQFDADGNLF